MQKIMLNLASDLTVNDNNQLTIKISTDSGNMITLGDAGLRVPASTGASGEKYKNGQMEGILVGAKGPWGGFYSSSYTGFADEVSVASCVHRTYTSFTPVATQTGSSYKFSADSLVDMRECDYVSPGDFIRVPEEGYQVGDDLSEAKFYYYIVTSAARVNDSDGNPEPHNDVSEAFLLYPEAI